MKEGGKGSGARARGWDGTGGQTAEWTPFLSFPISRVILKREVAEVSLAGRVVSDGFQEAIINPRDVDG
jgi:hypothetical protein